MRNWKPPELPKTTDPKVYEAFKRLSQFVVQAQAGFAKIDAGTSTDGSSSELGVTDHGDLDGLTDDDHTQYFLLAGRSGGQSALGDPGGTSTSTTPVLTLANFNLNSVSGAQRITLKGGGAADGQILVETPQFNVFERTYTTGFTLFLGADFCNGQNTGSFSFFGATGASTQVVLISNTGAADLGDHSLVIRARTGQTGDPLRYENAATTRLSYIRASDGAFVGPVVVSGGTGSFIDSGFQIVGSGDPTKIAMFEVDGVTAATTRTMTVPDFDGTIALFRSNKLRIGDTTAPTHHLEIVAGSTSIAPIRLTTGALTTSPQTGAIEYNTGNFYMTNSSGTRGRVMVATTQPLTQRIPFANTTGLTYTHDPNLTFVIGAGVDPDALHAESISADLASYNPADPHHAFLVPFGKALIGPDTDDGYSRGLQVGVQFTDDAVGNAAAFYAIMRANPSVDTLTNYLGFDGGVDVQGSASIGSGGSPGLGVIGLRGVVENQNAGITDTANPLTALYYTKNGHFQTNHAFCISNRWSHSFGTIDKAYGIYLDCRPAAGGAAVNTVYGVYIGDTSSGASAVYALYSVNGPAVWGGNMAIGSTTVPTHLLELAAGTTTVAPLLLASGTSLTSPAAGAVEMTTDDLFFTITTGAARKRLLMADPVGGLTSGRVPFATTNGRLTDDADLTFATDTLTVTKIAATQLTGNLTFADAINVILNTTTGTKIATATTQKLGFWNAAPIVQPATGGAAATFVANTSLIADDSATFDGYTIGQVVKALRNAGLLA